MGSKRKQALTGQKESFERKLKARLAFLSEKGIESRKIDRDTIAKKWRANIAAINARLKAIDTNEKKIEELARMKVEKAAAPRKEPEVIKEKKVKEPPVEGKEKKKKKE
ncbi:MAG: hypothetical protein ABSB79_01565 [Syntrophales bacterium]|jgi:hypothetical protein